MAQCVRGVRCAAIWCGSGRRRRCARCCPMWRTAAPIADLEPDGKGIPILVRQYVKLGAKLLAFSVDPQFNNALDGFVMVDLTATSPEMLTRYMGKERAREFQRGTGLCGLGWLRAVP